MEFEGNIDLKFKITAPDQKQAEEKLKEIAKLLTDVHWYAMKREVKEVNHA